MTAYTYIATITILFLATIWDSSNWPNFVVKFYFLILSIVGITVSIAAYLNRAI